MFTNSLKCIPFPIPPYDPDNPFTGYGPFGPIY